MDSMKLYRFLQNHVGVLNGVVVQLYNGTVSYEEAKEMIEKEKESLIAFLKTVV